jgi:hypothetical protein
MSVGRVFASGRVLRTGASFDSKDVATCYESWRADFGLSTATANVWTGRKNGLVLAQTTSGKRGTVVANQLNGFPCLRQDGVDDLLQLASFVHTQPYGVLMVFKCTPHAPGANDIALDLNSASDGVIIDTTPRTFLDGSAVCLYPNTVAANAYRYCIFYWNSTMAWISENGIVRKCSAISNIATTNITLGGLSTEAGTHWMAQDVVEVTPFGALTADDVGQLNNYCRVTYGLKGVG